MFHLDTWGSVMTLCAVAVLTVLVVFASLNATGIHIVVFSIFGASLFLFYLGKTLYGFSTSEETKNFWRILNDAQLHLLVAATYTPVYLIILSPAWGWSLFGVTWGLALCGAIARFVFKEKHMWVPTVLYLLVDWVIVAGFFPIHALLPQSGIFLLLFGGLLYSFGTLLSKQSFFVAHLFVRPSPLFSSIVFSLGSISHSALMFLFMFPIL